MSWWEASSLTNLNMPLLAHGIDNTPLDGSPTGATNWYTHLVMAWQAVELPLQFSGFSCQFLSVADTQEDSQALYTLPQLRKDIRDILKPYVQVYVRISGVSKARLTRSCCSWSGLGDTGRSWRSAAAPQWWRDTSGKYTCPGHGLSHGYDTGDTNAYGKVRKRNKIYYWLRFQIIFLKILFTAISDYTVVWRQLDTWVTTCYTSFHGALLGLQGATFTCQHFWRTPRLQAQPGKYRSGSSQGASYYSWPWWHGRWWILLRDTRTTLGFFKLQFKNCFLLFLPYCCYFQSSAQYFLTSTPWHRSIVRTILQCRVVLCYCYTFVAALRHTIREVPDNTSFKLLPEFRSHWARETI